MFHSFWVRQDHLWHVWSSEHPHFDATRFGLLLKKVNHIVHESMEIEQLLAKSKISMFNLGHIENILNYRTHIDNLVVKSLEVHAHSLLVLMAK